MPSRAEAQVEQEHATIRGGNSSQELCTCDAFSRGRTDHEKNAAWSFDTVLAAVGAQRNCEESAKGPAKARETCAVSRVNDPDRRYLKEPPSEMPQRLDHAGFDEIGLHARSGRLARQLQVHDVQAGRAGCVRDDDAHPEQCRERRLRIH